MIACLILYFKSFFIKLFFYFNIFLNKKLFENSFYIAALCYKFATPTQLDVYFEQRKLLPSEPHKKKEKLDVLTIFIQFSEKKSSQNITKFERHGQC
jgi:hypothetical protein